MNESGNPRYELRAYENNNACRLAAILTALVPEPATTISRDEVVAEWERRYPRHAAQTGRNTIRSRISYGLTLLKVAGIAHPQAESIVVLSTERLALAASNLEIVEDADGVALRPALWSRRPAAPAHLLAVQDPLETERLVAAAALNS